MYRDFFFGKIRINVEWESKTDPIVRGSWARIHFSMFSSVIFFEILSFGISYFHFSIDYDKGKFEYLKRSKLNR